jgi:hypothetical protein
MLSVVIELLMMSVNMLSVALPLVVSLLCDIKINFDCIILCECLVCQPGQGILTEEEATVQWTSLHQRVKINGFLY